MLAREAPVSAVSLAAKNAETKQTGNDDGEVQASP